MIHAPIQYIRWKRIFDLLFSLSLIVLLLPISVLFLLVIALETKAFPIFVQDRGLSLEGKLFGIYKLRTIREHAVHTLSLRYDIFSKPELASSVSPFCAWLRRTGLDELPQLWNILVGDMSFIGPRPLAVNDLEVMKQESPRLYSLRASLRSKVGLSGLWQLFGCRGEGIENLVRLDLEYDRTRSIRTDIALIIRTIPTVLFALHSDSIVKNRTTPRTAVVGKESVVFGLQENMVAAPLAVE